MLIPLTATALAAVSLVYHEIFYRGTVYMQHTKKILAAAAAILMFFSGCDITKTVENIQGEVFEKTQFEDDTNYTIVTPAAYIESVDYTANSKISYGYDSLYKKSQRTCYDRISEAAYKIAEEPNSEGYYAIGKVKIDYKDFIDKDMDICIKAYTMDHPEVFWVTNRYTYGTVGSQSVIQLYSYVSGSECRNRINEMNDAVDKFISGIPASLNQYHLEKYVHNAMLDGCSYAVGVQYAEDGWEEFTAYGALVKGSAVCEGYAHAMCMLLNRVGIECYYANGYGENAPHMWNTVKIDGNWYHLDSTWDDNENAYFNYFNLDDSRIQTDHVIEKVLSEINEDEALPSIYNIFLPICSSDNANYFVVESTYIGDFEESRDVMVNDLIEAAQNGDDMFTVRLNEDYDFNDALGVMFHEEPYYMFDYIKEANEYLDDEHQINNENLAIIMIENFNAFVVKLEY